MKIWQKCTLAASTAIAAVGAAVSNVSATPTMWDTLNETLDIVVGLLPKFGDLLTGVGSNLIWPVVYILIILGIAGIILGLFAMIVGIVSAVVIAVTRFSHKLGGSSHKY